ncbi:MAG: trigger factor [Spirosomataceae bacterium]
METTFDKYAATNARLTVTLEEADYQPEVDKKLKQYAKTAQIKGFRPGHVPMGYIKKVYGKSVLVDEVLNAVSKQVNQYILDNKLAVVGDPMPNEEAYSIDWDTQKTFTFAYEVGLASDFSLDLAQLPAIVQYAIEPAEARVDEAIEDLRRRFAGEETPESVEIGDLVFGMLTQSSTEFSFQSGIPTDKVVESAQHIFKGLEVGSSVSFDIQGLFATVRELGFATGKSDEEAAALSGVFEFAVTRITRPVLAEMNQEFFDKAVGPNKVTNEEELRAEIKSIIAQNYDRESQLLLDYDIEKSLLEATQIQLPEEFLKNWLFKINEGKFTEEEINKDYPAFARGLRLDLIKNHIAQDNEAIKVEYPDVVEEVKAEIYNYFGGQQFPGMEDFINQMAEKQLKEGKQDQFRNYFNKAFGRKVMEYIRGQVKVDSRQVPVEQFNEVAQASYSVL